MNALRHWTPGENVTENLTAEWLNLATEAIKDYLSRKGTRPGAVVAPTTPTVWVKNTSSSTTRRQYSIVSLGKPVRVPDEEGTFFFGKAVFEIEAPAAGQPFAIIQEPCPFDGCLAPASVVGWSWALVQIDDASHGYAAPINGDYDKLTSQATTGPAQILYKPAGATGEQWCIVDFPHGESNTLNNVPADGDHTAASGDYIQADTSGGNITITSPPDVTNNFFTVTKSTGDTNKAFIDLGDSTYTLSQHSESATFVYDGTAWMLVNHTAPPTFKPPADWATTAALPSSSYSNGTNGIGATVTGSSNGALTTQDGVTPTLGSVGFVKDETANPTRNGLYIVTQVGDGSNPFILTRHPSADTPGKLAGAKITVTQGTENLCSTWKYSGPAPTIGTSSLGFYREPNPKPPADYATTAPLPASTYSNGTSGVGATLTGDSNGALATQDGETPAQGDIIYVKDQADPEENGLYIVTQLGTAGTPFILTRHPSMQYSSQFVCAAIKILKGTINGDTIWTTGIAEPPTIGTTEIPSVLSGGIGKVLEGGNSITAAGTTDLGTVSGLAVTVTGNTGISSFGDLPDGMPPVKFITFTGTPPLTHSSSLSLLGGADITVAAGDTATFIYDHSTGDWAMADYARAAVVPFEGTTTPFTDVVLTSAFTIDNTSMESVTGFSFSVAANTTYIAEWVLLIETGDFMDFQLTGPASPTGVLIVFEGMQTPIAEPLTAFSSPSSFAGSSLTDFHVHIKAIIRNGANAGTVQLQAAMTTGGPQDIKVNSWMSVRESS